MIPMSLVGVRVEVPSNQPIVLLREAEGQRYLPIYIGPPEATAIVYALQGMDTPRPMTHDLFKTVLDDLGAKLTQVVVTELHDGTFYAEVEITRKDGSSSTLSSRPSDAIALAVRYPEQVPIFAREAVLDEAGVLFEPEENEQLDEQLIEQFSEFIDEVRPEDFARGSD
ncbi:MAG TPA: bifunctional nuclease family protein [Acidimicrobiia bacterium]